MPTYEYSCLKCGKTFEMFQSMKDAPIETCTCGKNGTVRRLVGRGAGIIFKGSGFYENDYRRRLPKAQKGGAGGENGAKGSSSPAPTPAGPAAPTPSTTPAKEQS
jgi:putative FmdB family regulatory protein